MLTSRFPGEVSGADLPTLTNPAGAGDMASGKQAIGQDGGVVTGSLETQSALAVLADTVSAGTVQGQPAITVSGPLGNDCILRNGASVDVSAQASAFGNAEAMDVAMVMPADGPSLGVAPSGTWMWMFQWSKMR